MSNEINDLMDEDPLSLTKSPEKLDQIIAYHRQNRALREAGKGRKAKKDTGEASQSMQELLKGMLERNKPKPATPAPGAKPASFRRV